MGMLVLASAGAPLKEAPLYGFLHGQVFYPVCLPWVDTVMRQYGNIDPLISAAFVGLIGFIGGLICIVFSTGVARPRAKASCSPRARAIPLDHAANFRTNIPIIGSSWIIRAIPPRAAWPCCKSPPSPESTAFVSGSPYFGFRRSLRRAHENAPKHGPTVAIATILLLLVVLIGPH